MLNRSQLYETICDVALQHGHNAWKIEALGMILEELNEWDRALEKIDGAKTPTNSDYMTALRVYQAWLDSRPENFNEYCEFSTWAKQRLNATK